MGGVKAKVFTQVSELVKFMNTVEVTTVISIIHDDSNTFTIIYQ